MASGQQLVDYNFCEIPPSSISGRVWSESDENLRFDAGDQPVPGVIIELLDSSGRVADTTRTDINGAYRFELLTPGIYSLRQIQPQGLFHGGQVVGSAGGEVGGADLLVGIELGAGTSADDYNFPEVPPATISGFVFQDGETLILDEPPSPSTLRELQDGLRTEDDTPIEGVTLQLRDEQGRVVRASQTLHGTYATSDVEAKTDSDGFYEFRGLRPGTYHVYQVHPDSYVDGLDTP